jgi:RHS repeat-associated protein
VQELSSGGAPTATANILTGLGIDEYFARTTVSPPARTSFLANALGSAIRLADDSAAMPTSYKYEPFGNVAAGGSNPGDANAYQFTGRENDATGLYYYRARYYSPTWGRFISEDPVTNQRGVSVPLGANRQAWARSAYEYVLGNPVMFKDPSGLDCSVWCACELFVCYCTRNDNDPSAAVWRS